MDDKELFKRAQEGEKVARDILFEKNAGLVHHVMKRFMPRIQTLRGVEIEDLYQLGAIGLIKAINKFDTEYGVCFSTYAVPMIMGEIRRFLRDDGMLKVSRSIRENSYKLAAARSGLQQRLGREPTIRELSIETGLCEEEVVMAIGAGLEVEQIDYAAGSERDSGENETERVIDRLMVQTLLKSLEDSERKLIMLRYYENRTQTQTAGELGMTQVQVSRLEKKIYKKLYKKYKYC